jgi:aminoglycoside phosphotransferase (APT) family kinase protein
VDFRRRRPSDEAIRWVERSLGHGHAVVAWRRMTGGITSAVHRLTVARGDHRFPLVLRRYPVGDESAAAVRSEVDVLTSLASTGISGPRALAACADGSESGDPAVLMTRVPGRVWLAPDDADVWLQQIALAAATVHAAPVHGAAFEFHRRRRERVPPASSSRPDLWRAAYAAAAAGDGSPASTFRHGDFQHFNFLWSCGKLSGIVDWVYASSGPPATDVGHCRLNLAVLFSADWAERFRLMYESEAGACVDPYWDLHALLSYDDAWMQFIPIQVDGRAPVDVNGMTARVEALLEKALERLGA